jgi:phosphatidylserine synthase
MTAKVILIFILSVLMITPIEYAKLKISALIEKYQTWAYSSPILVICYIFPPKY